MKKQIKSSNSDENSTFDFKTVSNFRSIPEQAILSATTTAADKVKNSSSTFDPSNLVVYRNIQIPSKDILLKKPDLSSLRQGPSSSFKDSSFSYNPKSLYQDSSLMVNNNNSSIPPQIPPKPFHLEKYSHTFTKMKPDKIIDFISESLRSESSDFDFNASKFKWKVNVYNMNKVVKIRIQVFSTSSNIYAIEFQRRKGCQMSFYSLFRSITSKWCQNGFLCNNLGTTKQPVQNNNAYDCPLQQKFKSFCRSSSSDQAIDSQENTLRSLLEMAESSFIDIQIEAVREIAVLSETNINRRVIVNIGMLPTLISLVQSPNNDVHRCSAVALANVSEGDSWTKQKLIDAGALESIMNLMQVKCNNFEHLESQRACARCLSSLCDVVDDDNKNSAIFYRAKSILREVHAHCTDPRLKKQCMVFTCGTDVPVY